MKRDYPIHPCGDIEKEAFAHLYNELWPLIEKYVYRITGCNENADDVRQEIFLKLWLHWGRLNMWDDERLQRYIFMMVRNLLVNQYRSRVRARNYKTQATYILSGGYKDDSIVIKEGLNILYKAIDKLPRRQKEIFELRDEELSIYEIAQVLNISPHTVKNSMGTAFKKVNAELSKELHIKIEKEGRKKLLDVAA